jgi:hypothetical protein
MKLRQSGAGDGMSASRSSEDYFLSMQMHGVLSAENSYHLVLASAEKITVPAA